MTPRILIVAGSDSGGGAGIQADIRTVTMLGGHAMTAITALTAQNTLGVQGIVPVDPDFVVQQMRSCIDDIGIDAVKIGMIGSAQTAHAVADVLAALDVPIVFDPVMVATSGSVLADAETIAAFARLMALASVVTPNLPERDALGGEAAMLRDARALLVKGGHGDGNTITDRLVGRDGEIARWSGARIATTSTHGTGCTLASAIAVGLARGLPLAGAVARARAFVRVALHDAPGLGAGHGPMGHHRVRLDADLGAPTPNQITLPLDDFDRSRDFYAMLGLTRIVDATPRYARFESAGGATLSIEARDELPGGPIVFIECGDLDAAVARVRAAGVTITDPRDERWGWREARLTDPAGNALCLYQAGENRRHPAWRLPHA